MKTSPKNTLVPILTALKHQLNEFNDDTLWKVAGMLGFFLVIYLPWQFASSYWWITEIFSEDKVWKSYWTLYIHSSLMMIGLYCFYGIFYYLNHPSIEKYKDNDVPWPWQIEDDWKPKIWKAIWVNLFNHLGLTGLVGLVGVMTGNARFRVEVEELPAFPVYFAQVFFLMMVEDTMFYWSHRLLHQPWIYPYIHKVHHEFYNSIVLTCEYAHPIEYILGNSLPSLVGSVALGGRCHLLSMLIFLTLRLVETAEAHSGYDFPFSLTKHLPFTCSPHYHNHHHLVNSGNYGSFLMIWDSICGTNSHFYRDESNYHRSLSDKKKKD